MNLLQVPTTMIGLMGSRPRQQNPMLGLMGDGGAPANGGQWGYVGGQDISPDRQLSPEEIDALFLTEQAQQASNGGGQWGYVGGQDVAPNRQLTPEEIDGLFLAADPSQMQNAQPVAPVAAQAQPQVQQQQAASGPAPRRRVSALGVLGRALAPNISGALDSERARLQAEADAPALLARAQENERIARALGPQALLAYRTNPSAFGESVGYQYRPTTTGAGGVSSIFGTGQQVEAPRVMEFGNDLVQAGPLSGTKTLATRGPSYSEQAQIARLTADERQDARRLELDYQKLRQDQSQFDQRLNFDQSKVESRPLSATQQKQLETYAQDVVSLEGTNEAINRYLGQLSNGTLQFGALENIESGVRNRLGLSDDNSRNQALFRSDMERLRNESLRLNTGVQTEGDAQRAWNELFGNLNDSRVVEQQLRRIKEINDRALQFRQGRIQAIEGRQFGGAPASGQSAAPALPPGFVLER